MEMQASRSLAVSQQQAWEALNDPETLKACLAGCDRFEPQGENQYAVGMAVKVGPVSAKFSGKVTLSDITPPERYRIAFEGQGGVAGFGKGEADVTLTPEPDDASGQPCCLLRYSVQAQVGGKIAQVGARLIDGTAKKLADEFFSKFAAMVGGPPAAEAAAAAPATAPGASAETVQMSAPAAAPAAATAAASSAAAQRGYRHWMIIGIGAVVLVLVYLASR